MVFTSAGAVFGTIILGKLFLVNTIKRNDSEARPWHSDKMTALYC